MILFAFESHQYISASLVSATGITGGAFRAERFENGEWQVKLQTPVGDEDCFILGSVAPPDEQLFCSLLLAHTLKKERARQVTAILPYLAYARHDKDKLGESLGTAWLGAVAQASGIDRILTVDVHSERGAKMFPIPVISLSPANIFAQALDRFGLKQATIVAPDEGAIPRCDAVKRAAGTAQETIPFFRKQRAATGILHSGLVGTVGRQVVIIDDMLDTGGTLVSACGRLREAGVEEIHIMVTHGLFTGDRWRELWRLGVRRIFCTNSVPGREFGDKIEQLSVVPLLEQGLCAIARA